MRFFALAASALLLASQASAEPIGYYKVPGVDYDPAITTPDAYLGFGLGDRPVRHDQLVGYLRILARQSPRISAETIGRSHEGRPILFFVIASEENQKRIEDIRARHLRRLDPSAPDDDGPAVIWLNYGVHGAESSGMDAAIPTLYHLAAARGEKIDATLANAVILVTAIFNPDGHSRRIDHVYRFGADVAVEDPAHAQHDLWMEARTNHYWFDLNRDWLLLTQPEARAWIRKWHQWKPHVSADFHEMGSNASYYFHPGEPRRNNPLMPERARSLLKELSKEHAAWLDSQGELYTAEEGFDNFYIGKGSTYPSVNGSVGILFEAGAARGGRIATDNGVRTYAQNIRIHFNTGLTTIEGTLKNRASLREHQRAFFAEARNLARAHPVKAYAISAGGDEARIDMFLDLLARHDIRSYRLSRDLDAAGKKFAAKTSFIVPLDQPQHRLIRGLFDRPTEFEENVFYDVSAWTMPLAYGLDHAALDGVRYNAGLLGERRKPRGTAKPAPQAAQYGYIFDWQDYYAPRALHRFQKEGVYARVLMKPKRLSVGGVERVFARGSIFIPFAGQTVERARIAELAAEAAMRDGVDIVPLSSGDAAAGGGDLGAGSSVKTLKAPKVLLLFGDGVASGSAGQIWYLLDHRMKMPVVLRRKASLGSVKLSDYTHLLLPAGGSFDDKTAEQVGAWIRAGGVLIATEDAAQFAEQKFLADAVRAAPAAPEPEHRRRDYAEKDLSDAEHVIGGAIFGSDLDPTHPLGFGVTGRAVATMKTAVARLNTPKDPFATVARYDDAPLLAGYASQRRLEEFARTPMLSAMRLGAGAVVLFADDPSFRATFIGADKLFMNAIFFAGTIDRAETAAAMSSPDSIE